MLNFVRNKERNHFNAGALGTLNFDKVDGICSWNGLLDCDKTGNRIELSIETHKEETPSNDRIKGFEAFLSSYNSLKEKLLAHIHNAYQQTQYAFPIEHVDKMFALAGVTSKENGDWWIVLEPGDVGSVYNHFIRFTVRDGSIVWASIN